MIKSYFSQIDSCNTYIPFFVVYNKVIIIIIIIIIIIKLSTKVQITWQRMSIGYLEPLVYLSSTNDWGDYKLTEIRSSQTKCWFFSRGENWFTRGENLFEQSREPSNSTHIWCWSWNRSWATLVEGECSHYCASPDTCFCYNDVVCI